MEILKSSHLVRSALGLFVLIILASCVGSVMPHIYYTWWFILLLSLFGVNLLLCTLKQLKSRKPKIGSLLCHLSILFILLGASISSLGSIRGDLEIFEGETKDSFITRRGQQRLDFKVYLEDFDLEWHKPRIFNLTTLVLDKGLKIRSQAEIGREYKIKDTPYSFTILNYVADLEGKSEQPHNPAILVRVNSAKGTEDRWVLSGHPPFGDTQDENIVFFYRWEGAIKEFRSRLKIIDKDKELLKTVEVNRPVKYKGYTFYQANYDPERLDWTGLEVAKDPGVPLVFLGFIFLNIGLCLTYLRFKGIP